MNIKINNGYSTEIFQRNILRRSIDLADLSRESGRPNQYKVMGIVTKITERFAEGLGNDVSDDYYEVISYGSEQRNTIPRGSSIHSFI